MRTYTIEEVARSPILNLGSDPAEYLLGTWGFGRVGST
jgi:hypothetical protein